MDDDEIKRMNRSEARMKYWASISREERSRRARKMANAKNEKMTPQQRHDHAMMMLEAKKK